MRLPFVEPTSSSTLAVPVRRGRNVLATVGMTYFRPAHAGEKYIKRSGIRAARMGLARLPDSCCEARSGPRPDAGTIEDIVDVLTKTDDTRRIAAATLRAFLTDALRACGLAEAAATTAAGAMLEADLIGSDAHGVFRLPTYVRELKRGAINPKAKIKLVERGPATALIDGDHGMGHVVMTHAAKLAVELARASGIGWVGARRSNHAGAGAIYAAMALEHGMVGIYGAASSINHMAPWGGTEALLGTNPIAVAIPSGTETPVVLDIATSLASNGAIRTYALEGRPMPEGWVQNRKDGSSITDPKRINDGTYLPMGDYKGSGLSIIIGLLAGPLNGAAFGRDIRDFAAPVGGDLNVGQFIIALDVARFLPLDVFKAEVDRHIRDLASSQRLPGVDEVRVPGQGRMARREEREKSGIPVSAALVSQVDEVAKSLGITPLSARS
jgi:L-2-hydroxycarboxylate dehydrogenase (NAD+)